MKKTTETLVNDVKKEAFLVYPFGDYQESEDGISQEEFRKCVYETQGFEAKNVCIILLTLEI